MVGETALRWEVLSHSGPEESLEPWKKSIGELGRCISLFPGFDRMLTFDLETANGNVRLSEEARRQIIIPECSVVYAGAGEDRWDEEEAGCRFGQVPGVFMYLLYYDTRSLRCKRKASNQYRHRTHFGRGGQE